MLMAALPSRSPRTARPSSACKRRTSISRSASTLPRAMPCIHTEPGVTGDKAIDVAIDDPYISMLAAMTDAAQYMRTVGDYEMSKMRVLVGPWANTVSTSGRAFAGCMGRTPNLVLGGLADALSLLISPWALIGSTLLEAAYTADIIMPEEHVRSRGTAVHEYGHVIMCDLMKDTHAIDFQLAGPRSSWSRALRQQTAKPASSPRDSPTTSQVRCSEDGLLQGRSNIPAQSLVLLHGRPAKGIGRGFQARR